MRIFPTGALGMRRCPSARLERSRQAQERSRRADSTERALIMNMSMRTLIVGAVMGIAAATISPSHAGVIGPEKLQITEPASLIEPARGRPGSGVSPGSTVRSGGPVAQGGTRVWPGRGTFVDSRSLNLKAVK